MNILKNMNLAQLCEMEDNIIHDMYGATTMDSLAQFIQQRKVVAAEIMLRQQPTRSS